MSARATATRTAAWRAAGEATKAARHNDWTHPMPFEKSQSPFSTHSPFSRTGRHDEALKAWPNDLPGLMVAIQNLLIYDVVAKPFYGVDLSLERQMDIHLRRVEDILDRAFGISTAPLTEPRPPRDRIAARCNNFGLLLLGGIGFAFWYFMNEQAKQAASVSNVQSTIGPGLNQANLLEMGSASTGQPVGGGGTAQAGATASGG